MKSGDIVISSSTLILSNWITPSTVMNFIIQQVASIAYMPLSAQGVREWDKKRKTISHTTKVEELNVKSFYHLKYFHR